MPSSQGTSSQGTRSRVASRLRPITHFLRYGLTLWAATLTATAEVAAMAQRGMQWRGDLVWTIDWLPVAFIMVAPIVAGFAAMDTARTAVGSEHLSRNPVLRTPSYAVTLAYAVALGITHLVVTGVALLVSAPPVGDRVAPVAIGCQLLMLWFFAALGAAVGRFAGPVLSGIGGGLLALVLVYLTSSPSGHVSLLEFGGATVPRIGYAYNGHYLVAQAGALFLAIVALLLLRPLEGRRYRRLARGDAAVACVLVAAVGAATWGVHTPRLVSVEDRPTYCGAVITIPTCFYPQHERIAAAFQEQFWVLAESATEKGYGRLLPSRVEEASRTVLPQTADPTAAPFYVMPEHLQGRAPTLWEIAVGLVQPLHCPQVRGDEPPSDRYWDDLDAVVGTWVGLADPAQAEENGFFGDPLPADRAAEIIEGFRTCTYQGF